MSFNIKIQSGTSARLPTAGKYCDRDILITTVSGDGGIADVYDAEKNPIEQGSISSASGNNTGSTTRLRNNGFIEIKPNVLYRISSNIDRFYIIQYGSDKDTVIQTGGWYSSPHLFTANAKSAFLRLTLANAGNTTITPDDFEWLTITQFDNGIDHSIEDAIIGRTISGDYVNDRVTALGSSAFRDCGNLTSISCENVASVSDRVIYDCQKLKTVSLPNVTTFGDYAIYNCRALTSIYVPKLEKTASQAFARSQALVELELPSIKTISSTCFDRCSKLTKLILSGDTVATLQGTAFTNTPIADGTGFVYVPDELVDAYKATWATYASQIKPISELEGA